MAVFNFGNGDSADSSDMQAVADALTKSGGSFNGSVVAGNSYGHSGGKVTGRIIGGKPEAESAE